MSLTTSPFRHKPTTDAAQSAAVPQSGPLGRGLGIDADETVELEPRLRPIGSHFVIAPTSGGEELLAALAAFPPQPDAMLVLAAAPDAGPILRRQLSRLATVASHRGDSALVLAASGLAAPTADGSRPAETLAAQAGLTVVAPDGAVSLRPDGTLRVEAPAGASASWWRCPPASPPQRLGPVWPTPQTRPPTGVAPAAAAGPQLVHGLAVSQLAHGYRITAMDARPDDARRLQSVQAASAAPGTPLLVIGTPSRPDVPEGPLARVVDSLGLTAAPLLSAPWAAPGDLVAMAAVVAERIGQPVRAAIGLPFRDAREVSHRIIDAGGVGTWEPLITELTADPDRRMVTISSWRVGDQGWASAAPAVFDAFPGWQLELVPAGLWLRPAGRPKDREPRFATPDPRHPLLIVGVDGVTVPVDVWSRMEPVIDNLPCDIALPLGLVLRGKADPPSLSLGSAFANAHQLVWLAAGTEAAPTPAPAPTPAAERAVTPAPPSPSPSSPSRAFAPGNTPAPVTASTPEDREAFKALVGEGYLLAASRAQAVATRLPGLRCAPDHDVKTDLVAVVLFHTCSDVPARRLELQDAARSADPGRLTSYLNCLTSGLRLLPSHHGAVSLGTHTTEPELELYAPGRVLFEPAPVVGLASPGASLGTPVEFAVWSTTGRRTALFGRGTQEVEVVFLPGTRFSVLDVVRSADGLRPHRVLLREVGATETTVDETRDRGARERLRTWLGQRDGLAPSERFAVERPERFQLTVGFAAG
jgi:hypothetical protein